MHIYHIYLPSTQIRKPLTYTASQHAQGTDRIHSCASCRMAQGFVYKPSGTLSHTSTCLQVQNCGMPTAVMSTCRFCCLWLRPFNICTFGATTPCRIDFLRRRLCGCFLPVLGSYCCKLYSPGPWQLLTSKVYQCLRWRLNEHLCS